MRGHVNLPRCASRRPTRISNLPNLLQLLCSKLPRECWTPYSLRWWCARNTSIQATPRGCRCSDCRWIRPPKSFVTLFTSEMHQSHFHVTVTVKTSPLPLERHPKLRGVMFDNHFFFAQQMLTVKTRQLNAVRSSKHWLEQTGDSKKNNYKYL